MRHRHTVRLLLLLSRGSILLTAPLHLQQRLHVFVRPERILPLLRQPLQGTPRRTAVPVDLLEQELGARYTVKRDGPVAACDGVLKSLGFREEGRIRDRGEGEFGQSDESILERWKEPE